MKNQKRNGVLISYINIILNMFVNIFLTPVLISVLSDEVYSIYKVIHSLAGPLIILNLGLATITTRCVAKYHAVDNGDKKEKENILAMSLIIAVLMAVVVILIGFMGRMMIPEIYGDNYSLEMIILAQKLFVVFSFSTALTIITDVFKGCVAGNERFVFRYGMQTLQLLLKLGLTVVLLQSGMGALGVAFVDLFNNIILLVLFSIYAVVFLKEYPRLYRWDWQEFQNILTFAVAILLQAIINQVNNNMDVVILGVYIEDKSIITMYSAALSIYVIYNSMISVFSSVFFPKAVRLIEQNDTREQLTDFVIGPGRIQAMIAVAVIGGFGLFGKEFIELWIGSRYTYAYNVALILMIPVTIPLVQNVCLSILDAKLKRMFRSVVLCLMAVLNVVISIILVQIMGFWGAAVGTAISLIAGHGVLMNIYYHKAIGLNIRRMFKEIFRGTFGCGIIAVLIISPLKLLFENNWVTFFIKCIAFCVIYITLLWKVGMNKEERRYVESYRKV